MAKFGAIKSNEEAPKVIPNIVDPTNYDDETLGYAMGDNWVNSISNQTFSCVDATTGNAIWKQVTDQISTRTLDDISAGSTNVHLTTTLRTNYDSAVTHAGSTHAPSDAQKNSDITKAEIEAKLTGEISTHTHAGGGGSGYSINVQALTSSPVDSQTVYFGMLPKVPVTTANISKVYIRKAGTIKIAEIYCYSGTAGNNQAWSLYIRKNNTTDYLIATVSLATNERVFSNASLNIPMLVGDYFEIKGVQPAWAVNPATTIYGGYVYLE
jgi:hypothetical protein